MLDKNTFLDKDPSAMTACLGDNKSARRVPERIQGSVPGLRHAFLNGAHVLQQHAGVMLVAHSVTACLWLQRRIITDACFTKMVLNDGLRARIC